MAIEIIKRLNHKQYSYKRLITIIIMTMMMMIMIDKPGLLATPFEERKEKEEHTSVNTITLHHLYSNCYRLIVDLDNDTKYLNCINHNY